MSVAFSLDGRLALSGSNDSTLRLWEVETGRSLRVLEGHSASIWSVAFSPDGRLALSGSDDNTAAVGSGDRPFAARTGGPLSQCHQRGLQSRWPRRSSA